MSLDDVKWLVGQFAHVFEGTIGRAPSVRCWLDTFEPTAHPDFVRLKAYELSFIPEAQRHEFDMLSSNGYGLARLEDWRPVYEALMAAGFSGIGFAIHGLEAEHDWFARRTGAYRDLIIAAQRALACGMRVWFEIHLNKRNLCSFSSIVDMLEELGGGKIRILAGVPGFFRNDRLREFETLLRPTRADIKPLAEVLERMKCGVETEASWTERLLEKGREACPHTYEPGGKGPSERTLGRLLVTPDFDVKELFFSRPAIPHRNIKRDGIESVWRSILETELPRLPEPEELAHTYGDFGSETLHPGGDSIYMKLCDRYWREGPERMR
jgi:MoaA/NifB/PqqE/SkfB family radical SAM enzyme